MLVLACALVCETIPDCAPGMSGSYSVSMERTVSLEMVWPYCHWRGLGVALQGWTGHFAGAGMIVAHAGSAWTWSPCERAVGQPDVLADRVAEGQAVDVEVDGLALPEVRDRTRAHAARSRRAYLGWEGHVDAARRLGGACSRGRGCRGVGDARVPGGEREQADDSDGEGSDQAQRHSASPRTRRCRSKGEDPHRWLTFAFLFLTRFRIVAGGVASTTHPRGRGDEDEQERRTTRRPAPATSPSPRGRVGQRDLARVRLGGVR